MEDRIMRKSMFYMLLASIAISCSLLYLPQFTVKANALISQYKSMREEARKRDEMSALDLLRYHEQKINEEEKRSLKDAIRIYMVEGLKSEDVKLEVDYYKHTIKLLFPDTKEDILDKYPIVGSTDHIDDMKVTATGEGLHVELKTDQLVEPVVEKQDHYCYVRLKDPHDLYDKIIVVDAGHGGKMPGTVSGGVTEKAINLEIVRALKPYMDAEKEVKVYYTRLSDKHVDLEDRAKLANELKADLFMSIHQNAVGYKFNNVKGTQVLYSQSDKTKKSRTFAKILLENITI